MNIRQTVCVVVDAYSSGNLLPRAFATYGYDTVHVKSGSSVPDVLTRSFRVSDFREEHLYDGDIEGLCTALTRNNQRPLCVLPGAESGVLLADRLATRLTSTGNGTTVSLSRRDKSEMANHVAAAQLSVIPHIQTASAVEAQTWVKQQGWGTVVVKPLSSSGTYGFTVCENSEEVGKAFDHLIGTRDIFSDVVETLLVQPYLVGDEFSVNAVSCGGQHLFCDVWKTKKKRVGSSNLYDLETMLSPLDPIYDTLTRYVRKVLDALGISYGPTHTEVFLTEIGPVLIESAARLMGSLDFSLVTQAMGTNAVILTAEAYLAEDRFLSRFQERPKPLRRFPALVQLLSESRGRLRRYGLEHLQQLPSFWGVDTYLAVGDAVVPTTNSYTSPGLVFLSADSSEEVFRDYRLIRQMERRGQIFEFEPDVVGA